MAGERAMAWVVVVMVMSAVVLAMTLTHWWLYGR